MDETTTPVRPQITVFLPCHALDDLPDWLEEYEADAVLAAWTAAWHPAVLAAAAGLPDWASLDLPWTREGSVVGLVPPGMAERFQAGVSPPPEAGQEFLCEHDSEQLLAALLAASGAADSDGAALTEWQREQIDDFRGLGLAVLLSERLARRMRTETNLSTTGFPEAVAAAAENWSTGNEPVARERLAEAFGCLEAVRDHYYPVDCWCLDLVLLAESSLAAIPAELDSPAPLAVLADPETLGQVASQPPALRDRLRERIDAGSLAVVGSLSPTIPLALVSPERLEAEVTRGRDAWEAAVGVQPTVYAQQAGPIAPLLPQVLSRLGYRGLLWNSFDGRSLPEPGMVRFQWEAAQSQIDAAAPKLLDARSTATILSLPTTLGDAMDHDHTVMVMFCHHAGTASPWFGLLRRVASWSGVFGRFVTPDSMLAETAEAAAPVRFPADSFPLRLAPETPLDSQTAVLAAESRQLLSGRDESARQLAGMNPQPEAVVQPNTAAEAMTTSQPVPRRAGWWWPRRSTVDPFTLTTSGLQLRVHQGTGGIVSVRRDGTGRNLLSQQLALRWPDTTAGPATAWRPAEAAYSSMVADGIDRQGQAISSHGRLLDAAGRTLASFTQTVSLLPETAAAILDLVVEPTAAAAALPQTEGDSWSRYLACRFAWNENDFCDVFRCLQTQLIATERQRFCSPWLLVLASEGGGLTRGSRGGKIEAGTSHLQLFCGELPWHVRSSPHTLDTLLATDLESGRRASPAAAAAGNDSGEPRETPALSAAGSMGEDLSGYFPRPVNCRLALGIDLPAAADRAISWAARGVLTPAGLLPGLPTDVRVTSACRLTDPAGLVGLRLRLLESAGCSQQVRLDWSHPIARAHCRCLAEVEPEEATGVAVVGTAVEYALARNEWVELEIWFSNDHHA